MSAELVVSGVSGESRQHCQCVHNTSHTFVGSGYISKSLNTPCPTPAWISWNCVAVTRHQCVLHWDSSFVKCCTHARGDTRYIPLDALWDNYP